MRLTATLLSTAGLAAWALWRYGRRWRRSVYAEYRAVRFGAIAAMQDWRWYRQSIPYRYLQMTASRTSSARQPGTVGGRLQWLSAKAVGALQRITQPGHISESSRSGSGTHNGISQTQS